MTTPNNFIDNSNEEIHQMLLEDDLCDQYDTLAAIGSGAIGGVIDIFLVGMSEESFLGNWTDKKTSQAVVSFAEKLGFDKQDKINPAKSAFQFLEDEYSVPYDQIFSKQTDHQVKNLTPSNHHLRSLGHSPDIVGLFFSILNQFSYTTSFISEGKIITVRSDKEEIIKKDGHRHRVPWELQGHDFKSRLFCGVTNWFGHLMSDVAGSSQTFKTEDKTRGRGIPIPFYNLFQFAEFGAINTENGALTFAEIAIKIYEQGYDFRHGLTMSIPVIITELSIRFIWSLRRYFQYGWSLKDAIPSQKNESLRLMLLFGHGTLSVIDALDAGLRSGGEPLLFFKRLNLLAWARFTLLVIKEIAIQIGMKQAVQSELVAYKKINQAIDNYLKELKTIDLDMYLQETKQYQRATKKLQNIQDSEDIVDKLLSIYAELELELSYNGDFGEHMSDKDGTLRFK